MEVVDSENNRTLILIFSNSAKTYLTIPFLQQKHEQIFVNTKSLNHYPNINAQTTDEIGPLENYENRTVVFDDMLLSKQESNIDLFFN